MSYAKGLWMSVFWDRLIAMGCKTYAEYLLSPMWQDFRTRYLRTEERVCLVCGGSRVQLHHLTYERLGREEFGDVVPLCQPHHEAVHNWLRKHKKCVGESDAAIKVLKRVKVPKVKAPKKKQRKRSRRELQRLKQLGRKVGSSGRRKGKNLLGWCNVCGGSAKLGKVFCRRHFPPTNGN